MSNGEIERREALTPLCLCVLLVADKFGKHGVSIMFDKSYNCDDDDDVHDIRNDNNDNNFYNSLHATEQHAIHIVLSLSAHFLINCIYSLQYAFHTTLLHTSTNHTHTKNNNNNDNDPQTTHTKTNKNVTKTESKVINTRLR